MRAEMKLSTSVTNSAEAMPKNRFAARSMCALGSASADASLVISVSTPSSGVIRKFTPKPAATPANAAAIPATGFRPTLLNATAPRGISTRYPASEATLETMPRSTITNVSIPGLVTATSLRISAPIRPAASARPTPIITTRMIVTALKLRKLSTKDVNKKRTPSTVSRPLILLVSVWTL